VAPAVSHYLPVFGQLRYELLKLVHLRTERAWDVSAGKRLSTTRIEKDEIEFSRLDGVEYIIPLLFSEELMNKVVADRVNFIASESHDCLLRRFECVTPL
jgi:hypothetical protein